MSNIETDASNFSPREIELLRRAKRVMSKPFQKEFLNQDEVVLEYLKLVVGNINYFPPLTDYTLESIPKFFDEAIILGAQMYSTFMLQQKWTMSDFSYNEGGININFDRVNKLDIFYKNAYELYENKVKIIKRNRWSSLVLATPRYANQLGTFVRLAIG